MVNSLYFGLTLTFSLLIALNLVGNTSVILVVLLNKCMHKPFNYLIVNLAMSDMTVAIFASIQFIVTPKLAVIQEPLIADFLCKFVIGGTLGWVGAVCSIFSLVGIASERYYAVIDPHRNYGKLTDRKLKGFIFASWSFALIWASPGFFVTTFITESRTCGHQWPREIYAKVYTIGWAFVAGVIPISIMGSLYYKIVCRLWFTNHEATEVSQRALLRYRRHMTKMVLSVTAVYVLCWVPELMIYFLGFLEVFSLKVVHHGVAFALVVFNSSINPVIYSFQSAQFRRHVWYLVCYRRRFNRPVYPTQNLTIVSEKKNVIRINTKPYVALSVSSVYGPPFAWAGL